MFEKTDETVRFSEGPKSDVETLIDSEYFGCDIAGFVGSEKYINILQFSRLARRFVNVFFPNSGIWSGRWPPQICKGIHIGSETTELIPDPFGDKLISQQQGSFDGPEKWKYVGNDDILKRFIRYFC